MNMRKTLIYPTIGAAFLLVGISIVLFTLLNPVLGGCLSYSNGVVICARTPDERLMIIGIFLILLSIIDIAYMLKLRTQLKKNHLKYQKET